MLPSIEQKLLVNSGFKSLVLSSISSVVKQELDRLTIGATPLNLAEDKLLTFLREKMKTGSFMDHSSSSATASNLYVVSILSLFSDDSNDDIVYTIDDQGAVNVDFDASKVILINKILSSGYLYGLAGVQGFEFECTVKTQIEKIDVDGNMLIVNNWSKPA